MTPLRPKAKKTHEVVERFRVPIAHREALDMEAAKRDLTMYQLMASIVAEWYDAHAPEKTRAPVSVSKPSKVASAPTMPVPAPAPAVTRAPDAKSVVDLRRRQVDLARKQVELLAKIPNRTPEEETQLVMALEHWEFVAGKLNEEYERSLRGGYTTTEQVIT